MYCATFKFVFGGPGSAGEASIADLFSAVCGVFMSGLDQALPGMLSSHESWLKFGDDVLSVKTSECDEYMAVLTVFLNDPAAFGGTYDDVAALFDSLDGAFRGMFAQGGALQSPNVLAYGAVLKEESAAQSSSGRRYFEVHNPNTCNWVPVLL
jgi:hypothetical protein